MPSYDGNKAIPTGGNNSHATMAPAAPVTSDTIDTSSIISPTPIFTNNIATFGSLAANSATATIRVPDVARAFSARKDWIINERVCAVQRYALASKRAGHVLLPEDPQTKEWLERIDGLLSLHEYDFAISPEMRDEAAVHTYLKLMFDDRRFHFPQNIRARAKALYEEYEACNWTAATEDADEEVEMGPDSGLDSSNEDDPATASAANAPNGHATVKLPPRDDPIWGRHGIMHGVAPKFGKIKTLVLDRRYLHDKRNAKVFGHNGLRPGAWFPNQLVVLFSGGHGASQGGICGKKGVGAYSVVVSGHYKDVDEDNGDTIIYSGPNSQTNTDPNNIPPGRVHILAHSLPAGNSPGRPVRVFRSATSHGMSPAVGIRYDGLYHIEEKLPEQKNAKGGLYGRFVVRRVPGQEALGSICARSPTVQQKRDYARIWNLAF